MMSIDRPRHFNGVMQFRTQMPSVTVIVLNWNGRDDTVACLESLAALDYGNFQVMVVDNGSTDGSVGAIRQRFPELEIIETGRNLGFAEGNNVGIRIALDREVQYVFLLNNDTVVHPSLLSELLAAAERCPEGGIFGAKILYHSDPSQIWYAGARWDDERMNFRHILNERDGHADERGVIATSYACGCAFLAKREVLQKVGLLDPKFFLTFEESDFCYRARNAGFLSYYVPAAILWHKISVSFGGPESPLVKYFLTRNRLLWGERHLSFKELIRLYKVTWWEINERFIPKPRDGKTSAAHTRGIRRVFDGISAMWQVPQNQAMAWGVLHYVLRRFGDAPEYVRKLGRSDFAQAMPSRKS